jgi:hypothetical protein
LNICEASKSGKRFRRPCMVSWLSAKGYYGFTTEDILANDWEVEEETISITRRQLAEALDTVAGGQNISFYVLCRELGFKNV